MTSVPQNIAARVTRARTDLLLSNPFFGALLFRLKLRPAGSVPLMATDGVSLLYNAAASASLKHAELVFVLAHEVMHPALRHHTRRGARDPKLWNVAADYAINPLLVDAGLFPPEGILIEDRFRGMSAEQIYHLLAQQQKEDGSGKPDSVSGRGNPQQTGSDPQSGRAESSSGDPHVPETPGGIGQVLDAPNPDDPGAPAIPEQLRDRNGNGVSPFNRPITQPRSPANSPRVSIGRSNRQKRLPSTGAKHCGAASRKYCSSTIPGRGRIAVSSAADYICPVRRKREQEKSPLPWTAPVPSTTVRCRPLPPSSDPLSKKAIPNAFTCCTSIPKCSARMCLNSANPFGWSRKAGAVRISGRSSPTSRRKLSNPTRLCF